jgi:hypothetical protein
VVEFRLRIYDKSFFRRQDASVVILYHAIPVSKVGREAYIVIMPEGTRSLF